MIATLIYRDGRTEEKTVITPWPPEIRISASACGKRKAALLILDPAATHVQGKLIYSEVEEKPTYDATSH